MKYWDLESAGLSLSLSVRLSFLSAERMNADGASRDRKSSGMKEYGRIRETKRRMRRIVPLCWPRVGFVTDDVYFDL